MQKVAHDDESWNLWEAETSSYLFVADADNRMEHSFNYGMNMIVYLLYTCTVLFSAPPSNVVISSPVLNP